MLANHISFILWWQCSFYIQLQTLKWCLLTFFFVDLAHHSSLLKSFWIPSGNISTPPPFPPSPMSSANLIRLASALLQSDLVRSLPGQSSWLLQILPPFLSHWSNLWLQSQLWLSQGARAVFWRSLMRGAVPV